MPVGLDALLHMSLFDTTFLPHFVEQTLMKDWLIDANFYAPEYLNWRLVNVEPLVLLYLLDSVAEVGIRYENLRN
jgi:hypothetical protein